MVNRSSDFFRQDAAMSQQLADLIPIYQRLAGSDPQISDSIAVLSYINNPENFKKSRIDFILGLLDFLRMSRFATSENTNEITKMGMQMPKSRKVIDVSDSV